MTTTGLSCDFLAFGNHRLALIRTKIPQARYRASLRRANSELSPQRYVDGNLCRYFISPIRPDSATARRRHGVPPESS